MKVGDLVRHKTQGWLAIIINIKESGPVSGTPEGGLPGIYKFPEFMWCDTGDIESCSFTLLEIVE